MILSELLSGTGARIVQGQPGIIVTGLSHDSRHVKPGDLFICIKGHRFNGHDLVAEVKRAGAVAVLVDEERGYPPGITIARVEATPAAMSVISDHFYGHPSGRLRLTGVTGTKGKTTSTYLCKAVFEAAGRTAGLIGTIRNMVGDREVPTTNTTPVSLDLQSLLADMVDAGVTHVAMEVSSHAVALGRIGGCEFAGGIFTNITLDHLDFHGTFENYLKAKASFFASLPPAAYASVNRDDPHSQTIIDACRCRIITYGLGPNADVRAEAIEYHPGGTNFTAVTPYGNARVALHLTGRFNVYNALGVIGAMLAEGIDLETIVTGLGKVSGVAGRFQLVPNRHKLTVIVDYAHSPDSLENVLCAGRGLFSGRLLVVFGCGGDRDRSKRPIMGRIAAELADYVVVTSDNPRTEDPRAILSDIIPGVVQGGKSEGEGFTVIEDRRLAIFHAISRMKPHDVLIIAGKGHETYQILRDRTIHFDDREAAHEALEEWTL